MKNPIIEQVKDYIREPFAFPGGYQKILFMTDGAVLCHACAKGNFRLIAESTREPAPGDQWAADYVELFMEGEPEQCAHCYTAIHAAYCDCQECEPGDELTGTVTYNVLLADGTTGTISNDTLDGQSAAAFIGDIVNVHLHDENGDPIEREGRLLEVLDETREAN